jgi:hypothetical protein
MEIEYGLMLNLARARKIEPIRSLLQDLHLLSYEPEDASATAAVRAALAKRGTPIGSYDFMIAGSALRHGSSWSRPTAVNSRGSTGWSGKIAERDEHPWCAPITRRRGGTDLTLARESAVLNLCKTPNYGKPEPGLEINRLS